MDLGDIRFDERDLDAALAEVAIDTELSIEVQRSLASRVLIAASLASAISSDEGYAAAVAALGESPNDPAHLAFLSDFSRSLASDLIGEVGEDVEHVRLMAKRIEALAV